MKFFLAVLAACMVAQTIAAVPSRKSTVDIAKIAMKLVVEVVGNATDVLEKLVKNYSGNEQEVNQKITAAIQKIGYEITEEVFEELGKLFDDMEPAASANGKKAIACIRQEGGVVEVAVNTSLAAVTQCVLPKVSALNVIVGQLVDPLNATHTILASADQKLDACVLGDLCLAQLVSNLLPLKDEVGPIVQDVIAIVKGAISLASGVVDCINSQKASILKNVVDIFDAAITCIDA